MDEWFDFEEKFPEVGQKIRVIKKLEFEGHWNGEEVMREDLNKPFGVKVTSVWQPCDG